ncbi:MAG: hypothetical protein ACREEE_02400 [Dongiaceae bacterium]
MAESMQSAAQAGAGVGSDRLRRDALGVAAITFFVVSAAAPLTAVAGGYPIAMLLGNGAGVPAAVVLVTVILLVFSVGYTAMARHIANAGSFYAFTARGLGGLAGGAAAYIALLAYNTRALRLVRRGDRRNHRGHVRHRGAVVGVVANRRGDCRRSWLSAD